MPHNSRYDSASYPLIAYPPPIYSPTQPRNTAESYMPSIRYGNTEPPSITIRTMYHSNFALLPQGHQHRITSATARIYEQACLTTETRIGWVIRIIGHTGPDFKILVHWYNRETGLFEAERFLWVDMWLVKDGWKIVVKEWVQATKKRVMDWMYKIF